MEYISDRSTLAVEGVNIGDELSAYKILDVYYDSMSNTYSYDFSNSFADYANAYEISIDEYLAFSQQGENNPELESFLKNYAREKQKNGIKGIELQGNGSTYQAEVEAGSYLVFPTKTIKQYQVMVGNLQFSLKNNVFGLQNAVINAKWEDVYVNVGVGKNKDSRINAGIFGQGDSFYYSFRVPASVLSPGHDGMPITLFLFNLDDGVVIDEVSAKMMTDGDTRTFTEAVGEADNLWISTVIRQEDVAILEEDDDADVPSLATIGPTGLLEESDVDRLVLNYDYFMLMENDWDGLHTDRAAYDEINIYLKCHLNEKRVVGPLSNNLTYVYYYSNDFYDQAIDITNFSKNQTLTGDVTVSTYEVKLTNYKINSETLVNGAKYCINAYDDDSCAIISENGEIVFPKSYGEGSYTLYNPVAASGYRINDEMQFEISSDDVNEDGVYEITVYSRETGLLPFTGGNGTLSFTFIGLFIIILSVIALIIYRKRSSNYKKS